VTCSVTIQNTIAGGVTRSTVTATSCLGAAGVGPPLGCTTTVTTSNQLVTDVNQCNGIVNGGGSNVTCKVTVINTIPVGTTASGVTVNQCIGSGQGGGTQPTVACAPTGNTTNATVDQCNGSGNGGGASMRVKCTVTGAATATPVTIQQCNGSANGGGSTVTCTTKITNDFITTPMPALTIAKSANPTTVTAVGQTVTYSFLVTNTGNVALTDIKVTDTPTTPAGSVTPACPGSIGSTGPTLAPGQFVTCTASYVVTQADLNNGSINDSAVAKGTSPAGTGVSSGPSTATVTAPASPGVSVAKSANPTTVTAVGQRITYTFIVTNTGNVTLTDIHVTDAQTAPAGTLTTPLTCPGTTGATGPTLNAGQTVTCTASYVVTQADQSKGSVADSAVARGTSPAGTPVASAASVVKVTVTSPASGGSNSGAGAGGGSGTTATSGGGSGGSSGAGSAGSGGATSSGAATGPLAVTGLAADSLLGLAAILILAGISLLVLAEHHRRHQRS
jgi:uncharacterized repeat protein (TIGR01451 family)